MGNFNDIVPKRLNITPARTATLSEAQSAPVPFDKYYTLKSTRTIQKLDTFFKLPAFSVPKNTLKYIGQYIFQYNVTAPAPFYILNKIVTDNSLTCILSVKYRIGRDVTRYFIAGNQVLEILGLRANVQAFPLYANQLIPQQCCFEVWCGALNNINPPNIGLLNDFYVQTNLKTNPPTPDATSFIIQPNGGPFVRTNESVVLPVNLPIVNAWTDTVWNTN